MLKKIVILFLLFGTIFSVQAQVNSNQFSYALKLYNEGFYDLASQQFSNFISNNPSDPQVPEAHFLLAKCYLHLNQSDLAIIELKKLALDFSQHPKAPEAWYTIGTIYEIKKEYAEAAKAFENIKILYPGTSLAAKGLLKAGINFLKLNDTENSFRVFTELINRYSQHDEALDAQLYLSEVELKRNNISRSIQYLQKLTTVSNDSIKNMAYLKLAQISLRVNNISDCQNYLNKIKSSYLNQDYAIVKTQLYWKNRQFDQAIQFLVKNKKLFFDMNIYRKNLAISYARNKDYKSALHTLKENLNDNLSQEMIALVNIYAARVGDFATLEKHLPSLKNSKIAFQIIYIAGKWALKNDQTTYFINLIKKLYQNQWDRIQSAKLFKIFLKAIFQTNDISTLKQILPVFNTMSPSPELADDFLFARIFYYWNTKNYKLANQLIENFKSRFPLSEYMPEVKKIAEKLSFYYKKADNNSFENILDVLTEFVENQNPYQKFLLLGNLYLQNTHNYQKAIQLYKKAIQSDEAEIRNACLKNLYFAYRALYQIDGNKEWKDSSAVYLQRYLNQETMLQAKASLLLEFFENSLKEIKKDEKRKKITLKKLAEMESEINDNLTKKINYIKFSLLPLDSQITYFLNGKLKMTENADELIYSLLNHKDRLDTSIFKDLNLVLIRDYSESYYTRFAVKNLLNVYFQQKKYSNWYQIYTFYRNHMPYCDDINVELQYAHYLLSQGKFNELESEFVNTFQSVSKNNAIMSEIFGNYPVYLFLLGKGAYIKDQYQLATKYLNEFLNVYLVQDDKTNESVKILGEIALENGNIENAIWYLRQYTLLDDNIDDFVRIKKIILELYKKEKKYNKLIDETSKLLALKSKTNSEIYWDYYKLIGDIHLEKLKKVETVFKRFEKNYKKNKDSQELLANLYIEYALYLRGKKSYKLAEKILKKANKYATAKQKERIIYLTGYLLSLQNENEKALDLLTKFSEKYPESDYLCKVYNVLGNIFYRMEKKPEALQVYNKALTVATSMDDKKLTLNNLIVLNKELGFWDGVLRAAKQYVKEFPEAEDNVDKRILIGLSYSRLSQFDEAIQYLSKIKPIVPVDREPEVQFYIGEAYFNSGRYEEAVAEFLKIPMFSKKTKLQWEASAFYYAGQAYERIGKKEEAIKMYKEIIRRPGILWELKKEAQKRINQIK